MFCVGIVSPNRKATVLYNFSSHARIIRVLSINYCPGHWNQGHRICNNVRSLSLRMSKKYNYVAVWCYEFRRQREWWIWGEWRGRGREDCEGCRADLGDGTHFLCHFYSTRCRADGTSTHRKTADMDSVTTSRHSGRLVGPASSFWIISYCRTILFCGWAA